MNEVLFRPVLKQDLNKVFALLQQLTAIDYSKRNINLVALSVELNMKLNLIQKITQISIMLNLQEVALKLTLRHVNFVKLKW